MNMEISKLAQFQENCLPKQMNTLFLLFLCHHTRVFANSITLFLLYIFDIENIEAEICEILRIS